MPRHDMGIVWKSMKMSCIWAGGSKKLTSQKIGKLKKISLSFCQGKRYVNLTLPYMVLKNYTVNAGALNAELILNWCMELTEEKGHK